MVIDSSIGSHGILSPYCTLNGNVKTGHTLFMGTRASILPKTNAGNNCTISAHTALKTEVGDGIIIQDKANQIQVKNRFI